MNYGEALDYLYGLINYEVQKPDRYAPDVVSLDRPRALLRELGHPHEKYPAIHLTGTKGKGSVSAMCASVLSAAGRRVGLYSSPHLQDFRERFQISGEMIAPETLTDLVARIKPAVERVPGLTWFEVVTAIAFLYFAEANVDFAVIEVGLGGRLDATNILRTPRVTTITSLSFDHTYLLGNTLREIAFEKGGIIKPGIPIVSAPQEDEARAELERIAAERGAPLTLVGRDVPFAPGDADEHGQWLTVENEAYWTPLIGAHQAINAAVAATTLRHVGIADPAIIREGLRYVNWPGRLEVVRRGLVLDAAHNGASAERLRDALASIFLAKRPSGRLILVFGASQDKDIHAIFRALLPITASLILMQARNPRAHQPERLAEIAREIGYQGAIQCEPRAADALMAAEGEAGDDDVICVTGSLFVVGEIRSVLGLAPARAAYLDALQTLTNVE